MISFFPVYMFASRLFKMLFPKEHFAKIATLMMRIITVPLSLFHFISPLNQILLFDRAAADEVTEV